MIGIYFLLGALIFVFLGGAIWTWFRGLADRKEFERMHYEQVIRKKKY